MNEKTEVARIDNPYGAAQREGGVVAVEQSKAIAEAIADRQIARANPRDRRQAMDMILTDCTLPSLAEDAVYEFARGGSEITGPTIRLAEVLAQRWGNLACGVKEVTRWTGPDGVGVSEVQTYAVDLETGFRDEKTFQVRHWRDTKKGGYKITDERDVYEAIANQGARRKRACILAIIPKDVQEAATRQCEVTLKSKIDITPERLSNMLKMFQSHGVTQEMIEKRIQRRLDSITPGMFVQLGKIANSLRDQMSVVTDWFEVEGSSVGKVAGEPDAPRQSRTEALAESLKKERKPAIQDPPAAKANAEQDAAQAKSSLPADPETGEITNETVRAAIAKAGSQERMTPLMMDTMRLPAGPERDETMRLWNARVMALKGGGAAVAPEEKKAEAPKPKEGGAPAARGGKPHGTKKIYDELMKRMAAAKTEAELVDVEADIQSHAWDEADKDELLKRLTACKEDLL